MLEKLNKLLTVEMEQWRKHGVKLRAVSASANGMVNSGITDKGLYFYRKWTGNKSEFVLG